MPVSRFRFQLSQPARLATLRATLRLLYSCHPRAFVTSSIASLFEPLFYPALLLLLHQLLQEVIGSGSTGRFTPAVAFVGLGLVILVLVQRLGIILRDSSSTILRQQAWVVISKRIMQKLPAVPYPLFENNAFQARYGLVIREASQRSITLVDSLLSTAPIFLGLLGLAVTLFVLAPLLVLAMVAISIPASLVEGRFSRAMYELQEHNAPNQLRMEALTNMQVGASWQRDVRVYQSDIIAREHAWLAETYLTEPQAPDGTLCRAAHHGRPGARPGHRVGADGPLRHHQPGTDQPAQPRHHHPRTHLALRHDRVTDLLGAVARRVAQLRGHPLRLPYAAL